MVELRRDIARQFEVLFLVFADRHVRALVNQDISGHQVGIGVEANRGTLLILSGLFLELSHAVEPTEPGHAIENPGQFRMCGNLTLIKDDVAFGVDAGRDHRRGRLADIGAQLIRFLPYGDGMHVNDAENAVVEIFLQVHPVANGA